MPEEATIGCAMPTGGPVGETVSEKPDEKLISRVVSKPTCFYPPSKRGHSIKPLFDRFLR